MGIGTGLVALATGALAALGGATGAGAGQTALTAGVTYLWQPCANVANGARVRKPVTAGTLELKRGGATARISLLAAGSSPASVGLPGAGPVSAVLVLETPRVRITGPFGGAVRRIPLGSATAANGRLSFAVGPAKALNGQVNTLVFLQRAARVAAVTAPRQLPLVKARLQTELLEGVGEPIQFRRPDVIDVGRTSGIDGQWEADALSHEYGHFVLATIAPDGSPGGDHEADRSYPNTPTLAWSEGFASAFAAVVNKDGAGALTFGCEPQLVLGSYPPRPQLRTKVDERYAQYNETRVGFATYQLIKRLGGGQRGLKRLLAALTSYRRDGHSVQSARDLRDLAVQQFERSAGDHAAIDGIFMGAGIGWDRRVTLGLAPTDPEFGLMSEAAATLVVRVTGPGGFDCRTTTDINGFQATSIDGGLQASGLKRADGGLPFSANDDCYLVSGTDRVDHFVPHTFGADSATIPFPYLAGGKHWAGEFTVWGKYLCEFDPPPADTSAAYCPTAMRVVVTPFNFALVSTTPSVVAGVPLSLARGVDTKVAVFEASGGCHVETFDCSV